MTAGARQRGELTLPVGERDHRQGAPGAQVVWVEYGDYQCPYCGMAYPVIKSLQRTLGRSLLFVFRNFPLTAAHPYAELAAEAAEAAASQGKFWEMHDLLYENQRRLGESLLLQAAGDLGLDSEKFMTDLSEHRFTARVREDFMSGVRSGVNGTPGFFINGQRYEGSADPGSLLSALSRPLQDLPGEAAVRKLK